MPDNRKRITLRAPKTDLAAIEKIARAEGRSTNSQIARVLREYIKSQQRAA